MAGVHRTASGSQPSRPALLGWQAMDERARDKKRKFLKNKKGEGNKLPPFVPMTWELLNSTGYQCLPYSASKALPYFFGKIKTPYNDPQKFLIDFTFSYPEGKRYGFSFGTFAKVIRALIAFGFIDPVDKGGLRGYKKGYNVFRLSKRWEKYGTPDFREIDWGTFFPKP